MYSRVHAALSLVVGVALAAVAPSATSRATVVAVALVVGVGVDVDHFVIARLNTGSWRHLLDCIRHPRRLVLDQAGIFEVGDVYRAQRILSHNVIGGVGVGLAWVLDPFIALVVGVTLYVHVLTDLVDDVRSREEYVARLAAE